MAARDPDMLRMIESTDLPEIAVAFGLGPIRDVEFLPSGLLNLSWRVVGATGAAAVKRLVGVDVRQATRSLDVLGLLSGSGIPIAEPLTTPAGTHLATAGDASYSALRWASGEHIGGGDLTIAQACELGTLLGRIHVALPSAAAKAGLEEPDGDVSAPVAEVDAVDGSIGRLLDVIAALPDPEPFDAEVAATLHRRRALLAQHQGARPATDQPLGPTGWTHGDFQPLNLLWRDGSVAAVLDWDRLAFAPLGEEVARAGVFLFRAVDGVELDLERIAAFVAAYRDEVPGLTRAEGADALDRMWWLLLTNLWMLRFRYDRGDTSCDHLYGPLWKTVEWWTERRDLVHEAFAAGAVQ